MPKKRTMRKFRQLVMKVASSPGAESPPKLPPDTATAPDTILNVSFDSLVRTRWYSPSTYFKNPDYCNIISSNNYNTVSINGVGFLQGLHRRVRNGDIL